MTFSRAKIIKERLDLLAGFSDRSDCLCRAFGSDATMEVNMLVAKWMEEAGLTSRIDNIGNVRGYYDNNKSKVFLMGSHLDTVIDAGKFDGPLGVIMAIDQAQHLNYSSFPYDFEVAGFSNEEGLRYPRCYLGSQVVAGGFENTWLNTTDNAQISLENAIQSMGGDPQQLAGDAIDPLRMAGYLEVHIEQGPVLDRSDCPLAVVSHIAAQQRHLVTVEGLSEHAGTVPMENRKDALAGAAALILEVEKTAGKYPSMVATVGRIVVSPGTTNVIPGHTVLSIDIRHHNPDELETAVGHLKKYTDKIATARQLTVTWDAVHEEDPVTCDQRLSDQLKQSVKKCGYPMKVLPSGAGHDVVALSKVTPVSMLFVRCKDGISHNPLEETSVEDISAAINVCDQFFKSF